ncbi:MAG: sigma 54-interacting transcriptional regulator [Desulfuromonadales bacterium]|nr:sigma 54-interacting transcriptional regulator [Desulfuromonadales bacterium]
MTIDKSKQPRGAGSKFRLLAEVQLAKRTTPLQSPRNEQEALRLVHELEIRQIELEMQNEALRDAQAELELARDKYTGLYDFAPVGYFSFDVRGVIRGLNLAGAQLLEIERERLINVPISDFIADAEERKVFSRHLKNVLQKEGLQGCEIKLSQKNGQAIYARIQSVAVNTNEKKGGGILSSIVDVTIAKQLESEIQDAREYAENIVETLREPLVVLDSDLQILTANHCFYDTFKVTPEETVGHFIYEVGNRQWDIPRLRFLIEEILPQNTVITDYEVEHVFPGIGHKIILLSARQIFREKIGSDIILLAMEDITDRKQLADELQKAHDKLESAVQKRTKELTRANLQLTEEIAERKKAEGSLQGTYVEIKRLKDRLQAENIYLQREVAKQYNFGEIIGQSDALAVIFSQVEQVAPMNATVLLLGETGTGKGVVARAIHRSSTRKDRPLITVNCSTLPAALVESELFGREKGAFTGSDTRQIGRFELADGGTIFLDEIGEMPLELQSKLLRVIQDGEFERLGSPRTIKTDVRIIAATNRNLKEEIRNGKFREDLYYRLNVFPVTMPPLRQRKEDIPLLVNHFVSKFNNKIGRKIETVSTNTLNLLQDYSWPGNVRELESVVERAVIISSGSSLQVLERFEAFQKTDELAGEVADETAGGAVKALADMERDHILQVLLKTAWRVEGKNGAAVLLGINPSTLRARMRKFGIVRQ